jgi:hypothetical protein
MSTFTRQQTVLLFKLPYDVLNIVNSFLFYERVVGETRKQKKKVCDLFAGKSPHFDESTTVNFYGKVFGGILVGQTAKSGDEITRFTYCHRDGWVNETGATSVFTCIKDGDKIQQKWNGFCNSCGDYTYVAQDFLWMEESAVEFYSPNMDVLCLCELDGIATVGTRRRPYPVGKALPW